MARSRGALNILYKINITKRVQHKNPESLFLYTSVILFPSYHPATNRKTNVYVKAVQKKWESQYEGRKPSVLQIIKQQTDNSRPITEDMNKTWLSRLPNLFSLALYKTATAGFQNMLDNNIIVNRYSDWLRTGRSGDRIPVGGEIFRTCPDRPWGPLRLL